MAEATPAAPPSTPSVPATAETPDGEALPSIDLTKFFAAAAKRGDILLALGVVSILVVLILPMPKWGMDIALAFSITFSVLILMVALFVERPLDFNAFPTILLLTERRCPALT